MAESIRLQIEEIEALPDRSAAYAALLHLQRRSADEPTAMESLARSSPSLLSLLFTDIQRPDEEIAAPALKCLGFFLYHPSLVSTVPEEVARSVLDALVKLIVTTRMKEICNLAVWCISIQQLGASVLESRVHSLVEALVHGLDNPFGSLSTTFEGIQAAMKLVSQISKTMRDLSSIWLPPIYRRLLSSNKTESNMADRCLLKMSSITSPPQSLLSKVLSSDIKQSLLPCMMDMLCNNLLKVQAIKAWGWYICLLVPISTSRRHLANKMFKIPAKTFCDPDPQVQIATLVVWQHLADAFLQPQSTNMEDKLYSGDKVEHSGFVPSSCDYHQGSLFKKIKLLMVPLRGIMPSKCSLAVRSCCLNTWHYVLHKLGVLVNHPSIIEVAFGSIVDAIFTKGPDNHNMCLWTSCIDLYYEYVQFKAKKTHLSAESLCYPVNKTQAGSFLDSKYLWGDYPIKWMPWDIDFLDLHLRLIGTIANLVAVEEIMASENKVMALNSALKIFRSVLEGVQIDFKRFTSNDKIHTCIDKILKFANKVGESLVSRQNYNQCDALFWTGLEFVKAITELLEPSILASSQCRIDLDIKYIKDMKCCEGFDYLIMSSLGVRSVDYMDRVLPIVYTTVLYLSMVAQSIVKLPHEDYRHLDLPFFLVKFSDSFHAFVSFMYMHLKKPVPERLKFLTIWSKIAKQIKELDCDIAGHHDIYLFLCYPLLVIAAVEKASFPSGNHGCSETCLAPQQVQGIGLVSEVYSLLSDFASRGSQNKNSSTNNFLEDFCELLVGFFDDNVGFFLDIVTCSARMKSANMVFLSVLGEATICIWESIQLFNYSVLKLKESDKKAAVCEVPSPTKNSLGLVSRFLGLSVAALKPSPQADLQDTIRIFAALVSFFDRRIVLKQDIHLLVEVNSDPLLQWLSSSALVYREMQQNEIFCQLEILCAQILDRSQPLIAFDSSLETRATLLQTALDRQREDLQPAQSLIPKLLKLSANGGFPCEGLDRLARELATPTVQKTTLTVNTEGYENVRGRCISTGPGQKRLKVTKYPIKAKEHSKYGLLFGSGSRMDASFSSVYAPERRERRRS